MMMMTLREGSYPLRLNLEERYHEKNQLSKMKIRDEKCYLKEEFLR